MNKNKKIISASLALALGVSLLIPNAKANEEKTVEKALKEPVKTSEKAKKEEKSDVVNEKITIKNAPVKEGGEENATGEEGNQAGEEGNQAGEEGNQAGEEGNQAGEEGNQAGEEGNQAGEEGNQIGDTKKTDDKTENQKTDEEKPKDENKAKPKEYKMSELLNEKGAFEKSKIANLAQLGVDITQSANDSSISEEKVNAMRLKYIELEKATTWDEMGKILGYSKEHLARQLLDLKGEKDVYDPDLVKIIDDMANQNPQNPSQKNPIRKNKKTATTNSQKTINTGNKVNNAGDNVQTGVGSLSAVLGLLGASSLGLFKSKRK